MLGQDQFTSINYTSVSKWQLGEKGQIKTPHKPPTNYTYKELEKKDLRKLVWWRHNHGQKEVI